MRATNHFIGLLNLLTFLLSVPILAGSMWLSTRANNTDCLNFLQWPYNYWDVYYACILCWFCWRLLSQHVFDVVIPRCRVLHHIAALIGFIAFAYAVTDKGSGRAVPHRPYLDYYLQDYSGCLEQRIASNIYWGKIRSCVRDSKVCAKMAATFNGIPEYAHMFYLRRLSPIEFGCCKPPTDCGYMYQTATVWTVGVSPSLFNPDCARWSNDPGQLCYACDSCKAGVLASLKKSWRKVSLINIIVTIILLIVYVIAYAAFRNNHRINNDEPSGEARMTKAHPSKIQF